MLTHCGCGPDTGQYPEPNTAMLWRKGGSTPSGSGGMGLPAILLAPNWNMLPMKGGGVLGLNGGGNIGGPVKFGGALKGP